MLRSRSAVALATASLLVGAFLSATTGADSAAAATTTYYVSESGNDAASGTSSTTPWRSLTKVNAAVLNPGDAVLFESGDSWTGQLAPTSSGSQAAPIVFGAYGTGNPPAINGAGAQPGTIVITRNSNLSFRNLDISNRSATAALRSGIVIDNALTTPLTGISLTDLTIHDISGVPYNGGNNGWVEPGDGGIIVTGRADSATSRVDNLLIQDVDIKTVDDAGIRINTRNNDARAINVRVNRVTVDNAGGNGIMMANTTDGVVEHSKVTNSGTRSTADAGIWGALSVRPVFQYNEVSGQSTLGGDGFAYDFDWGITDGVFQYNYSHDNPVGFMQFFLQSNGIVRYNVSQNDGGAAFAFYNAVDNMKIYNNTVFISPGSSTKPVEKVQAGAPTNTTFTNNLFVNWGTGSFDPIASYSNNLIFGNHTGADPSDSNLITADPLLVAPGTATTINAPEYKLRPSSPALGTGVLVPGAPATDYFGNTISTTEPPNIGAYAGAGVSAPQHAMTGLAVDDSVTGTANRQWNYQGNWGHCNPCAGDSSVKSQFNQSNSYSQTTGSTASMTFVGTRITLRAVIAPDAGIAAVSIDGGPAQNIDLYGYSRLGDRPVFTSNELAPGSHTVTVQVTGTHGAASTGNWVLLDRAEVTRVPVTVDDTFTASGANSLTYSSGWSSCKPCSGAQGNPPQYLNSNHWSATVGATATLTFSGTQAAFFAVKDANEGRVGVSVDGGPEVIIDLYSASRIGAVSVFTTPILASGTHTLKVRALGTKNGSASGTYVVIDRFDIYS
ncbi:hypothetical protein SRABI98_00641 [Microbacterium sp. Bi98]|nr:hypothetical protein SRABI98_00641 [Microbacterium sp. Bi98]